MERAELDLDAMLANAAWLRNLARCLASDQVEAEDLVQETWLAALRSPPAADRPPRPWLAEVARNLVRMGWRSASRRPRRVSRDLDLIDAGEAAPDEVMERLQLQRALATFVCELEEPYRTAITLRFYEGLPTAAIAARLDVPPGTARWRLSEGVRRLRERLDAGDEGQPRRWRVLVLGAPDASRAARWSPTPALATASAGALVVTLAVVLMPPRSPPALATAEASPVTDGRAAPIPAARISEQAARLAGFVEVALPALVSAAGEERPFTRDERIDDCLWHGERTWECRESSLEVMVNSWKLRQAAKGTPFGPYRSDPDTEAAFRQKRMDMLRRFQDQSPEDRRTTCAADADAATAKGAPGLPRTKDAAWHACFDGRDCAAASACVESLLRTWNREAIPKPGI